jgi:hypothetical protein
LNKAVFYIGLACLYLAQFFFLYLKGPDFQVLQIAWDAVFLLGICLALSFLAWLGSRWKAGHWSADALNSSGKRRRFLLFGAVFIFCIFSWGEYLDITDHLFW